MFENAKHDFLDSIKLRLEKNDMALSDLEEKLFDSVEFCLALLGTIPMPICIVDESGRVIPLNSAKYPNSDKGVSCLHCGRTEGGAWTLSDKDDCLLCKTIRDVLRTGQKALAKGPWKACVDGAEKEFVMLVHANPVSIDGRKYVLAVLEDLTEIEQLRGLLPICMECNKIYDGKSERWTRIDEYVTSNSSAKFSHGLCPECSREIIGNIEKD